MVLSSFHSHCESSVISRVTVGEDEKVKYCIILVPLLHSCVVKVHLCPPVAVIFATRNTCISLLFVL